MTKTVLVCVGACAIDTILTVPHFPVEDSKLRATSCSKRRGGNSPNTLEVLQLLLEDDHSHPQDGEDGAGSSTPHLFLVATLPAQTSTDTALITSSFNLPIESSTPTSPNHVDERDSNHQRSRVNLSHSIYRSDLSEPVASYIIYSQATSSRTIVNNNALPEMTFAEFKASNEQILEQVLQEDVSSTARIWYHFEGRIPPTILECMHYLRHHSAFSSGESKKSNRCKLKISVELEKPGREGLQDLAYGADVVFYSRAWATGMQYHNAEMCLQRQADIFSASKGVLDTDEKLLICPWGEQGAFALVWKRDVSSASQSAGESQGNWDVVPSPAYALSNRKIVDSTGAGDTFIAGMLYGLVCRNGLGTSSHPPWSLRQMLDFANGLAGRKILQEGFRGLGESSRSIRRQTSKMMQ